ncbi:MAG: recombinase family protein [bacterium]
MSNNNFNSNGIRRIAIYERGYKVPANEEAYRACQINSLKEYAIKHGYIVVKVYSDKECDNMPGAADNRPKFRKMMDFIRMNANPVDAILVYWFNRLAFNSDDYQLYKKELNENYVKVISASELYEPYSMRSSSAELCYMVCADQREIFDLEAKLSYLKSRKTRVCEDNEEDYDEEGYGS